MKSDWHPGLVSKEYKENFDEIKWEGTSGRYWWRKIILGDNTGNWGLISEGKREKEEE